MYLYFLQEIIPEQECGYYFITKGVFLTRKEALKNVTSKLIGNTEFPNTNNKGYQRIIAFKVGLIDEQFVYETNQKWFYNSISVGEYREEYLRNITGLIDTKVIYDLNDIKSQIDLYKQFYEIKEVISYRSKNVISNVPFEGCNKEHRWLLVLKSYII